MAKLKFAWYVYSGWIENPAVKNDETEQTLSKMRQQIAALPIRWDKEGRLRILLITSRETKRWVMPKGWPMDGHEPWRAAKIEALEEAGVRGYISDEAIGAYRYDKILEDGSRLPCLVQLYPMMVDKMLKTWKERHERKRRWFSAKGAAKAVNEPDLKDILEKLDTKPRKQPVIRNLLKAS
jgi:8-oxo-dGTP pyrophosphatase MutT (NUDIX family)